MVAADSGEKRLPGDSVRVLCCLIPIGYPFDSYCSRNLEAKTKTSLTGSVGLRSLGMEP